MAKDPTQGPVSTYDEFGNPIKANVDEPIVEAAEDVIAEDATEEESEEATTEETVEETVIDESNVEEAEDEVAEGATDGEDIATSEIEDTTKPEKEAPIEEADYSELEGPAESDEKAPEDGIAPMEDLWDRLTEVGAESSRDGVVRHIEFTCDRCGETKEGMLFAGGWAGFYAIDSYPDNLSNKDFGWAKYANEGEKIICDACMHSDERYLADYPDEPKADTEETAFVDEKDEKAAEPAAEMAEEVVEEEEFVTHEHEVKPPLTYNEAETMLMETSFVKMRELAIADGIKPERSRVKVMRQLLALWFPPPTSAPADDEPEMSVRIRRAKGLM